MNHIFITTLQKISRVPGKCIERVQSRHMCVIQTKHPLTQNQETSHKKILKCNQQEYNLIFTSQAKNPFAQGEYLCSLTTKKESKYNVMKGHKFKPLQDSQQHKTQAAYFVSIATEKQKVNAQKKHSSMLIADQESLGLSTRSQMNIYLALKQKDVKHMHKKSINPSAICKQHSQFAQHQAAYLSHFPTRRHEDG